MARPSGEMRAWARLGAEVRLQQIRAERQAILQTFPVLGGVTRQGADGSAPSGRRRRRRMSAAQRKAHSERMKRIWAERRKNAR